MSGIQTLLSPSVPDLPDVLGSLHSDGSYLEVYFHCEQAGSSHLAQFTGQVLWLVSDIASLVCNVHTLLLLLVHVCVCVCVREFVVLYNYLG